VTRACRHLLAVLLGALLLLGSHVPAHAASVSSLAKKLADDDDFRVRTQAALALGRSKSKRAVNPLCKGLDDDNDSVRAASAAALGKLKLGGLSCLKKRFKEEKSRNVKKMIRKSIKLINNKKSGPSISSSSKYYIAISPTNDKTGRGGGKVDQLVRRTIVGASRSLGGSVIAPRGETKDQAKQLLRKHRQLEAFKLAPTVHPLQYSNGALTVELEVLVYGYPGNNLQGTVSRSATMTGVGSKDEAKEDQLIEALAKSAMEQFSQLVAQLD
jgi:hypothetical protein